VLSTGYVHLAASGLAICVSVWVAFYARMAIRRAAQAYHAADRRAPGLKHLAEMSAELTELKDAYDSLLKSHKKLRSRIGMRANREEQHASTDDGLPAPDDPNWKKKTRVALAKAGKLNAKFHTS